jgi:hypothetical protein
MLAAAILVGALVSETQARRQCTLSDLEGAWGFTLTGVVTEAVKTGPVAANGAFTADRHGNLTGSDTLSFNGTIVPRTWTAIATIDPDCTGSLTVTIVNPSNVFPALHVNFAFAEREEEFRFIETDAGTVITGSAHKQ